MICLATFYSHFGAMRFKKLCEKKKLSAQLMPVPRNLSSSCGTCVQWAGAPLPLSEINQEEVEQIVTVTPEGYQVLYRAKNS